MEVRLLKKDWLETGLNLLRILGGIDFGNNFTLLLLLY
jgi:hypothetical protein